MRPSGHPVFIVVLALTLIPACQGERARPEEGADSVSPGTMERAARPSGPGACRLSPPFTEPTAGVRLQIPWAGAATPGWSVGQARDRRAALADITEDGRLTSRTVESPIGPVHYTIQSRNAPGQPNSTLVVAFAFRRAGDWYRVQIPIQAADTALMRSCVDLVPRALSTLSAAE